MQKNKHIPEREVKFNKHQHNISKWIMNGILLSIKYKDYLYKIHKMTDPYSIEFEIQKVNLKTYHNILKKSIKLMKKNLL